MPTLIEKLKNVVKALLTLPSCRPVSVGGSVRDAIIACGPDKILEGFEKYTKDFDLEIFGNVTAHQVKQVLAEAGIEIELVGKSFPVYKVKGTEIDISFPRTEVKTGIKHTDFALTVDPTMTFKEAAERRDFTCNAIGYDWRSNTILDPYHGIVFIKGKLLHPVSYKFDEDALRALRAFKFIARLGFDASSETLVRCIRLAPQLKTYARERVLPEWTDFMLNSRPERIQDAFNFLFQSSIVGHLYSEISDIEEIAQHPEHHPEGKVLQHTIHCLEYFAKNIRGNLANDEERLIVGFAVLTHDFGKATCTSIKDGKIIAHGHEDSPLARQFLERLFDPADDRIRQIELLVKAHMRPVSLYKAKANISTIRRLNKAVEGRIDRLMALVECDQGGRPPKPVNKEAINWVLEKAKELNMELNVPIKPIVLGRHIKEHLKLKSGPLYGIIIDEMFEEQLEGVFSDEATGIERLIARYRE